MTDNKGSASFMNAYDSVAEKVKSGRIIRSQSKMVKEYTPNPEWTARGLKAIEMNDLYYKIRKDFGDKKIKDIFLDIKQYEDLKDESIVKEYPILLANESKIIKLINSHDIIRGELVLN